MADIINTERSNLSYISLTQQLEQWTYTVIIRAHHGFKVKTVFSAVFCIDCTIRKVNVNISIVALNVFLCTFAECLRSEHEEVPGCDDG